MPLIIKDRVKENSVTSSTGTLTLTGAPQSFQTFSSAIGNGNTTYYAITEQGTGNFEVGLGTVGAGTLSRDTVLESSNAGSLVNFGSASKDVFCTYPAEKAVIVDATGAVNLPLSTFGATTTNIGINSGTANTVQIGSTNASAFSTIEIGQADGENSPTITNINGLVNFTDTASTISFPSGTFSGNLSTSGSLGATGTLSLTGSATVNQNIATAQTSGNLVIGGTSQTTGTISIGGTTGTSSGAITLGRSTGAQTVNIATGVNTAGIKTVNIGTGGTFTTNMALGNASGGGTLTFGLSTGTQTVNIATGATTTTNTKTVNIGTSAASATSTTNITIGATAGTSTTTVQGYFKPPALASAPAYVLGAVYFDTTLNKLRVGGATTWETITSI
jgi:hypothetical protein